MTEQKFVNTPHLIPPSDGDSIDEIEGYLNVDSEEFGLVLSELEYSGLQYSDLDRYVM